MEGAAAGGTPSDKGPPSDKGTGSDAPSSSGTLRMLIIAAAGAAVTGLIVAGAIGSGGFGMLSHSSEPTLAALAPSDIPAAMATLDPATSQEAVADAKACRAPMAWVTLVKQAGSPDGTVRIRSGSYLSPPVRVTEVPQRIALPYPAPYATGHGVLWAVGEGSGVTVYLTPGWNVPALNGGDGASINVVWTPRNPC